MLVNFWEDRHPVVRNVMTLTALTLLVVAILSTLMLAGPALWSIDTTLALATMDTNWVWGQVIVVGLLFVSFLRACVLVWQQRIGVVGFGLVCVGPLVVMGAFSAMPTFFAAAVGHQMRTPFTTVYQEFRALCDEWDMRYGEVEVISFRPEEVPLGIFERDDVDIWRERYTVFVDFSDDNQRFGLACVVGGAEAPFAEGRYSRYFEYRHLQGKYYEFYRERN